MKTNERQLIYYHFHEVFKPFVKSIYHVPGASSESFFSDLDILAFYDDISAFNLNSLFCRFTDILKSVFRKSIFIRWSTSSLFEPVELVEGVDYPIVIDILLLKYLGNGIVSQIGFDSGILCRMLNKGKLAFGEAPPFENLSILNSFSSKSMTIYYQNNISQLIELCSKINIPFYVVLNSIKILSYALYKYAAILNEYRVSRIEYDRKKIANVISVEHPNIGRQIELIFDRVKIKPSSLSINDAKVVLDGSFKVVKQLFDIALILME